jgi:site-specific recombinase XerD
LGRKLPAEISADELRHIQAKMKAKAKRGPHTFNRYFAALRHILNLAIAESYLVTNPVEGVRFFPEPTGHLKFLTEAEIARLRDISHPDTGKWWPFL